MPTLPPPSFRYLSPFIALAVTCSTVSSCASNDGTGAPATCSGLDTTVRAQATLRAYAEAATSLQERAAEVEAKFLAVCNAVNSEIGEDATQKTADQACAVLKRRIDRAVGNGAAIEANIAFNCRADLQAQAACEGSCQVEADCDVRAKCQGGEVVVACNGQCSGQCDVTAPDFQCQGRCEGACTADIQAICQGECRGTCTAPSFTGTCDTGCSAGFEGSCEGTCNGTCDGKSSSAACAGTCSGSCSGKATGTCQASCTGAFRGGDCTGEGR